MENYIDMFKQLDSVTIQQALDAVLARHKEVYPDWDIGIIAINNRADKNIQIDKAIALLQGLKEFEPDTDSLTQKFNKGEDFLHLYENTSCK